MRNEALLASDDNWTSKIKSLRSPEHNSTYSYQIGKFNRWNENTPITMDRVRAYLKGLTAKGARPATVRLAKAALKSGIRNSFARDSHNTVWLATLDAAFRSIPVAVPIRSLRSSDIVSPREARQLIAETPPKVSLMIRMLFNTGLRASELVNIKLRDCQPHGKRTYIRVIGKGNKERQIDIATPLFQKIKKVFGSEKQTDHLFLSHKTLTGGPYSRQHVWREINRWSEELLGRRIRTHGLRHSHATALINAGIPIDAVADRLGHTDRATTAKFYLHSKPDPKRLRSVEI